jgi:DNA-binding NtrC family response regulator
MVERAIILCKGNLLGVDDFPLKHQNSASSDMQGETVNLKNNEIQIIQKALQSVRYNQKAAADILGITRDALIRKMKKYNIRINKTEL